MSTSTAPTPRRRQDGTAAELLAELRELRHRRAELLASSRSSTPPSEGRVVDRLATVVYDDGGTLIDADAAAARLGRSRSWLTHLSDADAYPMRVWLPAANGQGRPTQAYSTSGIAEWIVRRRTTRRGPVES